ncbi:MAG: DUF2442 domain-containing protein [Luteitalea sp.]|nr:DUF2442 domain-containing protein [Luteitalea sp.]
MWSGVETRIDDIEATDDVITARLVDGRVISVPLAWSWRLSDATPKQRANWTLIGDGHGVHWPDIDEDVSAEGMLHGIPARRPRGRPTRHRRPASSVAMPASRVSSRALPKRRARAARSDRQA